MLGAYFCQPQSCEFFSLVLTLGFCGFDGNESGRSRSEQVWLEVRRFLLRLSFAPQLQHPEIAANQLIVPPALSESDSQGLS